MAWIESHQSLSRHRKTLRAIAILHVDRHKFIGHMHELWWWGLDNVPKDGGLDGLSDEEIAEGAQWKGNPGVFVQALITSEFIDVDEGGERWLHDWYDYAGKLLTRREKNRDRMRNARAPREGDPRETRAQHVQDTCDACAPATVPNRTVPNRTNESSSVVEGGAGGRPSAAVITPPSLEEFDTTLRTIPAYKPTANFYRTVADQFIRVNLALEAAKIVEYLPSEANKKGRKGTTAFVLNWLEIAEERRKRTETATEGSEASRKQCKDFRVLGDV